MDDESREEEITIRTRVAPSLAFRACVCEDLPVLGVMP